ncbi:DnaJ-domain-containing protein [Macrolepiota fuliginosa MF-IS2]|uniref:DnaJ-domain-containing protein n=1 Tax=Macrolepiota fuliginosa MF-IS2 TaxID=1400762 RepID=A0A9P5XK55_9AGAR|nr:DnaJ-domain-containing protein [Macrolepiota fuliginosa MF-IS2]
MDDQDPISQFFPDQESVDLYEVLHLTNKATADEIKKAYRRLALVYHPDKHATASDEAKANASLRFQQIGFAYAVLSDEKRKEKYDKTGSTTEGFDHGVGENGWEAYFEDLFERVTRGKLDEMKKEYQGSSEEIDDLKSAYLETRGSIGEIMTYIPHSTVDDEPRFIVSLTELINKGNLPKMKEWEKSIRDEKARLVRRKEGEDEAKEAETLAKELGVWDEFYGSGRAGERKSKSKGKNRAAKGEDEDEEDTAALQALILRKKEERAVDMDSFFDELAAKYGGKDKGKKRGRGEPDDEGEASTKRVRVGPPDIPEEEFAILKEKLFPSLATFKLPTKSKPRKKGRKTAKR